jgi:hypothetical protein
MGKEGAERSLRLYCAPPKLSGLVHDVRRYLALVLRERIVLVPAHAFGAASSQATPKEAIERSAESDLA